MNAARSFATLAGLPTGSAFVTGAFAALASHIDAPAAMRATFPQANPAIHLIPGIPLVYQITRIRQKALP